MKSSQKHPDDTPINGQGPPCVCPALADMYENLGLMDKNQDKIFAKIIAGLSSGPSKKISL